MQRKRRVVQAATAATVPIMGPLVRPLVPPGPLQHPGADALFRRMMEIGAERAVRRQRDAAHFRAGVIVGMLAKAGQA